VGHDMHVLVESTAALFMPTVDRPDSHTSYYLILTTYYLLKSKNISKMTSVTMKF